MPAEHGAWRTVACAAVIPVLLSACPSREEKVPEHVAQQQAARARAQLRGKSRSSSAPPAAEQHHHGHDEESGAASKPAFQPSVDERLWPPNEQLAFQQLYRADFRASVSAARMLAQQGLAAVPAMRALLASKRQPKHKKVSVAFLLVGLHMFRPDDLAKLAREQDQPLLQRGALEALVRLDSPAARAQLDRLARDEPLHAAGIELARQQARWKLSDEQVRALDTVLHAAGVPELQQTLEGIGPRDRAMEAPLRAMLSSPVTRPLVHAAVVHQLLEIAKRDTKRLRGYVEPGHPRALRLGAARRLLERGRRPDRQYVATLSRSPGDPLAPTLQAMLRTQR